ncbi:MAG: CHAT domain-containing protein [Verrucomicrobia bacterium]|nr:CHAT domain-containing protein [Verrucomicrobiota bacterium]
MEILAIAILFFSFLFDCQRSLAEPTEAEITQLVKAFETETDSVRRLQLLRQHSEHETSELLKALTQRGQQLYDEGDYPHAIALQQTAIVLAEDLHDLAGQADAARKLGATYAWQGKYREALQEDTEALTIVAPLPDSERKKRVRMATLNNIGNVYNLQRQFPLAEDYYQQALTIARELGDRAVIAKVSNNLGDLDLSENKIDAAESAGNESLKIADELKLGSTKAQALILLGLVAQNRRQFEQALTRYNEAYDLYKTEDFKEGMIRALHQQGETLLDSSKLDDAKVAFQKASALAEEIDIPDLLWPCYCNEAEIAVQKHDDQTAKLFFEQAIATIEDIRLDLSGGAQGGAGFLTDKMVAYHGLMRLLLAKGDLAEALVQAERAKGRALLDALNSGTQLAQNLSKKESDELEQLSAGLAALNKEVLNLRQENKPDQTRLADLEVKRQHARNEIQAFLTDLGARAPQLERQAGLPFKMADATRILRNPETAAVEYVVTDDKLYAFVLTLDRNPALVSIDISSSDLKKLVSEFRSDLTNPQHPIPKKSSQALYERAFAPVRPYLQGIENLIIVPDGPLWDLPFQALRSEHYLLEDFTISQAPSLAVLHEMSHSLDQLKQAESPAYSLLVFDNPSESSDKNPTSQSTVSRGEKFAPLPESAREASVLRDLYGSSARVFAGADATESAFKAEAGAADIIELATHAVVSDHNPLYSFILLSPDSSKGEDGLLETWKIMQLKLRARLVVLSACETARGEITAGEGITGLAWGFFVAGCPTLVASQWPVESASTTELMLEFHRQLRSGLSTANALRAAELKLRQNEEYAHPFYWASFIVAGAAE